MTFNPSIPQSTDKLSASQPVLLSNNLAIDNSFGVDHYKFSDGTADNGKHETVTTPNIAIPTTTADPKIYGHQLTAPLTTLQFSKGVSDAIATPLTSIQSTSADSTFTAFQTKNILDFAGITRAVFHVRADLLSPDINTSSQLFTASFSGGAFKIRQYNTTPASVVFILSSAGTNLRLQSQLATSGAYWTIQFLRLE